MVEGALMIQTPRPVAILGGNRIPFARADGAYAQASTSDLLAAALDGLITRFGLYSGLYGGRRGGLDQGNAAVVVLAVVAVSAVVYALAFLLTRALSRYRELSADRAAALLTGRPSTLASALTKVSGEMARIPSRDLRQVEAFNTFFFAPALSPELSLSSLFSSHPPLQRRLDQLAELASQYGKEV